VRTIRDAILMSGTSFANLVVRVLGIVVLARLLTPDQFGLAVFPMAVVSVLAVIAELDLRDALIQRPTIGRLHVRLALSVLVLVGGGLTAAVVALAPVVERTSGLDGVAPVLAGLAGIVLLQAVTAVPEALLIRAGRIGANARALFAGFALGFTPVAIVTAILGWGHWALVSAYGAQAVMVLTMMALGLRGVSADAIAPAPETPTRSGAVLRDLFRYSLAGTANRMLGRLSRQVDTLVVGGALGATALGYYSRAYTLAATPIETLIGMTVRTAVFPAYARMQDQSARLAQAMNRSVAAALLVLLPVAVTLAVLAPEVVAILLGSQWGPAVLPLQVLAVPLSLRFAPRLMTAMGRATGRLVTVLSVNFGSVCLIAAAITIGAQWGLTGASVGLSGALILVWLIALQVAARLAGTTLALLLAAHIRPVLLTLVLAVGLGMGAAVGRHMALPDVVTVVFALALGGGLAVGTVLAAPSRVLDTWSRGVAHQALARVIPDRPPVAGLRRRLLRRFAGEVGLEAPNSSAGEEPSR